MKSSRPYLLRALNDWILDSQLTPYVVVDASLPAVDVPRDFVSNGQIVLNISPHAVRGLAIDNEYLEFSARFGGVPRQVTVPIVAVLAIYAKENGQGMVFGSEPGGGPDSDEDADKPAPPNEGGDRKKSPPKSGGKPSLKIVK